jgi:F-box protein 9
LSFRSYLKKESEESKVGTSERGGSFAKNEEDFEFIKYLHLDDDYKSHITPQSNGDDKAKSKKNHEDLIKIDPLHKLIETWFNPPTNDEAESQDEGSNDKSKESRSEPVKEVKSNLLEYGALDPKKPVHLNILPKEAIVKVLQCLALYDMPSVHRFSLTCKRSFLISREQSLWQHLADLYYDPSYCNYKNFEKTNPDYAIDEFVDEHYFGVYQYFWTEYPKIRYDGIYISTCSYIRQGSSESTFNNPVHLVTYYRYIRFYPDGTLIKLLTPDEPVNIVKLLYKESKYKGIMQGQFELTGDLLNVEFKDYQQHRRHLTFNALLNLKSTHRGLFNKLSWIEYYSTDIRDESFDDRSIYSLKQFKPFYFSKVKSIKNWLSLHENNSLNK